MLPTDMRGMAAPPVVCTLRCASVALAVICGTEMATVYTLPLNPRTGRRGATGGSLCPSRRYDGCHEAGWCTCHRATQQVKST